MELLVTVSLLLLMLGIPLLTFGRVLNSAEARGAAQAVQGIMAEAQVETLSLGGRNLTSISPKSCSIVRLLAAVPGSSRLVSSEELPDVSVTTNVDRWTDGTAVRVAFSGWLAAPDSAGSVFFGEAGVGSRVVVRAATGLTRREHR